MENTDLFEWSRRPGFSKFCPVSLNAGEIVNQFYSNRNLDGEVISVFDSNQRLSQFTDTVIDTIFTKSTVDQGFITQVGNFAFFSDGATNDFQMWDTAAPLSSINPSLWGLTSPTIPPSIFNTGCWLPMGVHPLNSAILDPNGNVEVVTATFGTGAPMSGATEPIWPATTSSTTRDGNIQWTNMGPLLSWMPDTFYPVPVVILDTNGNLQLATASVAVPAWSVTTAYTVGETVSFGGGFFTAVTANTGVAPTPYYNITTTVGSVSTSQPDWVVSPNPTQTGSYAVSPFTPTWNTAVGGTTVDGSYTWTNLGPGFFVETFGTSYVYCYRTIYGHLTTASQPSTNTGSIFGSVVVTITSFEIADDVVTFQGTNNYLPGSVFSVQDLFVGTYLNGQTFIVLAAGLSTTQFSANFISPPVASTVDQGTTLPLIATVTGIGTNSPLCNATAIITAYSVLNNVVTLFAENNFVPGLQVTISGLVTASFLNNMQFEIINVDPAGTWFQVLFTSPQGAPLENVNTTPDIGLAVFNAIEIYRVSDGGGIYLFTGAVTNPTGPTGAYDSGFQLAGTGSNVTGSGAFTWTNPQNVASTTSYATNAITAPVVGSLGNFTVLQSTNTGVFGSNVVAGDTILVFVSANLGSVSVSDNQGNSYSPIATEGNLIIYQAASTAAGATTVTVTNAILFGAIECNGFSGTVQVPAGNSQSGSVTTFNSGTITVTGSPAVAFSFVYNTCVGSITQPNGYTTALSQRAGTPSTIENFGVSYQVIPVIASTVSPTWDIEATGSSTNVGITVALNMLLASVSHGLLATDFGFTVPSGVQIAGIEVEFDAFFSGTIPDGLIEIQLSRGFGGVGTKMFVPISNSSVTYTFGSPSNLWGLTLTPGIVNSMSFGALITAVLLQGGTNSTFEVRNVNIRVFGNTNTPQWSFSDFTADADLDELQIAPQNNQNDPPPGAPGSTVTQTIGNITAYWNGRLWMVSGNYVYFTAGPDCTNGDPQSSWPPANRFQFAGPPIALVPSPDGGGLIVCLADRYNAILGGPETISFYPSDALSNFGISNFNALFRERSSVGQFTTQGQYIDIVGGQTEDTGNHIADYLEENFSPELAYVTMHRNGLDVGLFISNGVDRVLRFGTNITAWSVPAFPIGGAGALRSIETSVGTYSLMLASPTAGSPYSYLLVRDLNSWGDGGTFGANDGSSYSSCFITLGSITLSQPGAPLFPLQNVVIYANAVGTLDHGGPSQPTIWIMPNEVSDTAGIGFIQLPEVLQEPPIGQTNPSKSLLALRYPVNMMNSALASQFVHHLQVKIQFEPESAPNTIKAISFMEDARN